VDEAQEKAGKITAENAGYVAKLQEKDSQLFSLKADYAKLQGELVEIAKAATATKQVDRFPRQSRCSRPNIKSGLVHGIGHTIRHL
jgi:hypothetical protein